MAVNEVRLISKRGDLPPTTVSLDARAMVVNLSYVDRRLKKAGQPELRRLFESDDKTWLRASEVRTAFENTREFFNDPDSFDDIHFGLYEVLVEELDTAIGVLRALPKDSVIRLEIIKSKPRKPAKSKSARTGSSGSAAASSLLKKKLAKKAVGAKTGTSLELTAKQREYVQSLLERYRCDADLWAFPDIERKTRLLQIDRHSGLNLIETLRRNLREKQPQLDEEECEALVEACLFSSIDLLMRGLARRIAFNLLSDMRTALSMEARVHWLDHRRYHTKGGSYPDVWRILRALAARDVAIARRSLDLSDEPLKGPGNRPAILLYNAMFAIFRGDEASNDV